MLPVLAALAVLALLHLAAVLYLWQRCARREAFWRHALRRSSLLALYNAFVYLTSALPDRPYQDAAHLDQLAALRERWREIREEALALVARGGVGAPVWCNDPAIAAFFARGWTRFYLRWHGQILPSARSACPRTVELLDALPTVRGAMLAVLPAQARIEAHTDPFAGGLRLHLGLSVPTAAGCTLSVDGERRTWREGEALVFDETYLHEVANETDQDRLILFCDVERPLRWHWAHALHRPLRAFLMSWTAIQNVETDPVGWRGRAFGWANRPLRLGRRGGRHAPG